MPNQKITKNKEWQKEEAHLEECRALIVANVAEYERQYEERHKETKALFDAVQSGNIELYNQMTTSRSLEEHSCRITEYLSKIREEVERKKKRWDMMGNGGITRDTVVFKC